MIRGLAFLAAMIAVVYLVDRRRRRQAERLAEPRGDAMRVGGIPVYCADCCENDPRLRRQLSRDGRCLTCGSASVVIITDRPRPSVPLERTEPVMALIERVSAADLEHAAAVARLRATISGRPSVVSVDSGRVH